MAKTSKGIYYPYDYNEIADVPEDMKQMAETINKILEEKEVDETTQNAKITTLQNKVNDLQQENTELSNNMPWNTTSGKSLHITDSAKYSKNKLSISGDMEQEKRSGKNKFKLPESATSNGVTLTNNGDGTFNLSGTATAQANFLIPVKNTFAEGKSYTISSNQQIGAVRYYIHNCTNTGTWKKTQLDFINETTKTKTFSASTTDYISCNIVVVNGATVNLTNVKVQIEEGTTETDWEKYGATPSTEFPSMPLVCTGVQKIRQFEKNLFDVNDKTSTYTVDKDGWVTVSVTNRNTVNEIYANVYTKASKNIRQNTNYSVILEIKSISGEGAIRTVSNSATSSPSQFDRNLAYNFANLHAGDIKIDTITSKSDFTNCIVMLRTFIAVPPGRSGSITFRISVIEDTSVTAENFVYEPYTEEINTLDLNTTELCAIKDTNGNVVAKDRHVYRNGKWQWEKIIKKRVLNGTENWTDDTVSTVNHFRGKLDNLTYSKTNNAYCDKFICRTSEAHGEWEYIYIIGKACFINIDNTKLTEVSLNGFKTWLSNNNVTVYYVLATPEYIDCTAEQSAILDKLHSNFTLQKGTNNIIVESENGVGVNMQLDYMQDNILKNSYEVNEVNTGKKWIDGKDIYRKVVKVTDLSSGNNRIAHNINNFNELIDIRGTGNWNGNWQTIPRLVTDAVSTFGLGLGDVNDTKFLIQVGTNYTNFTKAYIIIEYTKAVEVVE